MGMPSASSSDYEVTEPEYPDPTPTPVDETNAEVADAGRNQRKQVSENYNRQDTLLSGSLSSDKSSAAKSSVLGG